MATQTCLSGRSIAASNLSTGASARPVAPCKAFSARESLKIASQLPAQRCQGRKGAAMTVAQAAGNGSATAGA